MNEENIKPALNLQDGIPSEMSAAEFQQRLYGWFEDRGLLSEVRAHLRRQMIGALKDTAIGRTITGQQKHSISPKLQALNLLIAEFLLHQDYHYSLSVFSTEVPLINILPEFQGLAVNHHLGKNNVSKKWQFSETDMWDILETLGITQDTDDGQNIYEIYYSHNTTTEPLLTCIIRMLHSIQTKSRANLNEIKSDKEIATSSSTQMIVHLSNHQEWVKHVAHLLSSTNVNVQTTNEILNIVISIVQSEKKRLEKESKEEYLKLQLKLQAQASRREEEHKSRWLLLNNSLEYEKSKLENEKAQRQMDTDGLKAKLLKQQSMLRERAQKVYSRERNIHEREYALQEKEEDLNKQHQRLQAQFTLLIKEQETVSDLRNKFQQEIDHKQMTARNDAEFLKNLQEECVNMKAEITDTQKVFLNVSNEQVDDFEHDAEQSLIRSIMKQLHSENVDLKNVNSEQQTRIDELSQRATNLLRDLESTQATVNRLSNSRYITTSRIVSAPPLTAPPNLTISHHRHGINVYSNGGGEDGSRVVQSSPPREYKHYPSPRDIKRRTPPRRLTVHSSSASDDSTPTNDILQEAREKLRRLEQESDEVDKHYRQFRLRRTEEGKFSKSKYLSHSPWLVEMSREYDQILHNQNEAQSTSPEIANKNQYDTYWDLPEYLQSVPGPSRIIYKHNSSKYYQDDNPQTEDNYGHNLTFETAIRDSDQPVPNYETALNEPGPSNINVQFHKNSIPDVENEAHRSSVELSFDSSEVFEDIMAAGTSGISLTTLETSDKSDSQPESAND